MPTCLVCGRELPGDFAFCPFCGAEVTASAPSAERQRRIVTVLFCDLVGSTAAAEGADVEDVERRLTAYHDRVRERIEAYGGTVEKFVGDAVMAVFGAPVAHEDDAERAVRAGLSITEVVDDLVGVHVRVGINTGEALVALGARPEAGESFVIGDTVNTAARMQSAAPIDAVVVAESTYRATDRVFEYAELEAVTAKGKAQPLSLWRALAAKARFGTDLMRNLEVPMVGRGVELATLVNAFDRARGGQTQLVTVLGEAGVGKSRLVAELFAHIDRQPFLVTWRQGRCLPYGDGITFWALSEVVKAHLGIYDGDTDEDVRAKLDQLEQAGVSAWVASSLASLVGLPGTESNDREVTFDAWRQFFEAMTEPQPVVVVVEDLHWADPVLLDFLEYVVDWPGGSRLLLVGTARPELLAARPTWTAGLPNAATVRLAPLSADDTADLITTLGNVELSDSVRQLVVERSGGNPLYAEELVRMLRDRPGSGADTELTVSSLPDTVQALIAARLDTLAPLDRELLHAAAVVGKVFWSGAVAALLGRPVAEVDQLLPALARKDMLRPMRRSTVPGDREWAFTHVLIRDVAYQQQLREVRAERHLATAAWLIDTNGDRVRDVAEILVHHTATAMELATALDEPTLVARARPLLRRSLTWAAQHLRGLEQDRALAYADRARALIDDGTAPADVADVLEAWIDLAVQTRSLGAALEAADEALEARRASADPLRLAGTLVMGSTWARNGHDPERANRYRAELGELLPLLPTGPERIEALTESAMWSMFEGDNARSLELATAGAAEAAADGEPRDDTMAGAWISAHNALGLSTIRSGDADGLVHLDEAIRVAEKWRPHRALYIGNNRATALAVSVGLSAGLAEYDRVVALCAERGLRHSAAWIESSSLVFRLAAGDLVGTFTYGQELSAQLRALGSLVVVESAAAAVSAAVELGRRAEIAAFADELVAAAMADLDAGVEDVDTRTIIMAGAADALLSAGEGTRAGELIHFMMARGADAYELFPRIGRFARVAHAIGDQDLLATLVTTMPDTIAMGHAGRLVAGGLAADLAGQPHEAVAQLSSAALAYDDLHARLEAAYARLGAAEAAARRGLVEGGVRDDLVAALAEFESMQAWPAAARCQALSP